MQTNFKKGRSGYVMFSIDYDNNNKEVGLVYIALASNNGVEVSEFNFGKPRGRVIDKTVNKALELLQKEILKNK